MSEQGFEEIGRLVKAKDAAYGSAVAKSGDFMRVLYPCGVQPEHLGDLAAVVRIVDKLFRIATAPGAFGEDPWADIAGYALVKVEQGRRERASTRTLKETATELAAASVERAREVLDRVLEREGPPAGMTLELAKDAARVGREAAEPARVGHRAAPFWTRLQVAAEELMRLQPDDVRPEGWEKVIGSGDVPALASLVEETATRIRAARVEPPNAEPKRVEMWCPFCGQQHEDVGEWATKPHRTHLCAACRAKWTVEPRVYGVREPDAGAEPLGDVAPKARERALAHLERLTEGLRNELLSAAEVRSKETAGWSARCARLREELQDERAGERARIEAEIRAGGLIAERAVRDCQAEVKKLHERYAQETRSLLGAVPAALRREVGLKDTEEGLTASLAATVRNLVAAVHVRDENRASILLSWRHALGATDGGEMGIERLKTITAGLMGELEVARGELGRLGTEAREANRRARLHESNAAQFERTWHALRERAEKAERELAEMVRAEREACAHVADEHARLQIGKDRETGAWVANNIAAKIRERGAVNAVVADTSQMPHLASLGRVDCVDASSAKWSVQLLEPFPTDLRARLSRGRVKVNASNLGEPRVGEWEIREWSIQWTEPGMLVLEPAGGSEAIQAGDWLWLVMPF